SRSIAEGLLLAVSVGCGGGAPPAPAQSAPSSATASTPPATASTPSAAVSAPEPALAGRVDGMVRVAAGYFLRGSPPGVGLDDERPQRKLWLDAFDIDRTEVTVEAYARCVAAKACDAPRCSKPDHAPETRPDHPVVCVR